jgi:hypothetical protein
MPPIIQIPTQQELLNIRNSPTNLLAMYQAAQQPRLPMGIPTTPGVAATTPGAAVSSLPGYTSATPTALPRQITPTLVPQPTPIDLPSVPQNDPQWISAMTEMVNQLNMQAQGAANAARIPGAMGLESQALGT